MRGGRRNEDDGAVDVAAVHVPRSLSLSILRVLLLCVFLLCESFYYVPF